MPKIEYGINERRIAEIKSELEQLKVERVDSFIEGDQTKVDYYTSRILELNTELETLNVMENQNSSKVCGLWK